MEKSGFFKIETQWPSKQKHVSMHKTGGYASRQVVYSFKFMSRWIIAEWRINQD
jgi:hypothetical protein